MEADFFGYCGAVEYELEGGDTGYLTFDEETRTLTVYADDPIYDGIYSHKMYARLNGTEDRTSETFFEFKVQVTSCPTGWSINEDTLDRNNPYTNAPPIYYVIDDTAPNTLSLPFRFNPMPTSCPITWHYDFYVNTTDT